MYDFREQIETLSHEHTTTELQQRLAERLDKEPAEISSINPVTKAMFDRIVPEHDPLEYAQSWEGYLDEWPPVKKRATALRMLLTEQIGRPAYERLPGLRKQDWAELLAAVNAADNGVERGAGNHVPTTLPRAAEQYLGDPPERTSLPASPFDDTVRLSAGQITRLSSWLIKQYDAPYAVYVLECTPPIGEAESEVMRSLRRDVLAKRQAGYEFDVLEPKEQAAAAANDGCRIYYVGSTADVEKRVREHMTGASKSATRFTNDVPPISLVEVIGCQSRREAEQRERERAEQLNARKDSFAYYN